MKSKIADRIIVSEDQARLSWRWPAGYTSKSFTIRTSEIEVQFKLHKIKKAAGLWVQIPGLENAGDRIAAHRLSHLAPFKLNALTFKYPADGVAIEPVIEAICMAVRKIGQKVRVVHTVSFGGSMAARLVGKFDLDKLIMEAPAVRITALKKTSVAKFPFLLLMQKIGLMQKVMDLPKQMSWNFIWKAMISVPVDWWKKGMPETLVILYKGDQVVDSNRIQRYFKKIPNTKIVILSGDPKRRRHLAEDYREVAKVEAEFVGNIRS